MSGHSKWHSIKHKKAAIDAKRGAAFTKVIKMITVAARSGGNPDANPSLRMALQKAKESNMPQDNIERAIKKGTGELPGVIYESANYEGYATGGVAVLVEVLTENKNRTSAEIRNIFSKKGGNMAGANAVSWLFEKKGLFVIKASAVNEDRLMNIALDAGAEDMAREGDTYEVKTQPNDFEKVRKAIEDAGIAVDSSELTMIPKNTVKIDEVAKAKQILQLIEALEEHDDVQNVYANFDIPEEILVESASSE